MLFIGSFKVGSIPGMINKEVIIIKNICMYKECMYKECISFIPLHSCDSIKEVPIKINVATDEDNSRNET